MNSFDPDEHLTEIGALAHKLWIQAGRPVGCYREFWEKATLTVGEKQPSNGGPKSSTESPKKPAI